MAKKPSKPPASLPEADDQTLISPIEVARHAQTAQKPALLVISGPNIGRTILIEKNEWMIGRADNCDLTVEDDLVSRHHCKIVIHDDRAEIIDLKSTNGTLLNGRRIDQMTLKDGDQIQVGSVAIFKYHLQEEVQATFLNELFNAATKDFLTNTYNKKFFLDRLQNEFHYTKRHGGNLSVLVIDIDHFKRVNDKYGHLAGDLALQKVAHHLITHTRKDDLVARFGGEEFVILMRDCDLVQARTLAEHLREGISKIPIQYDGKSFSVTISAGIACLSQSNQTKFARFENLIENADSQLYKAKSSGRNRVCAA